MLSFISTILEPCFKSLNKTRLNSLSKAIACIALGLRTCHLLDVTHLNQSQSKALIKRLHKAKHKKHPSCRSLVLLQFKDTFTFLGHRKRLQEHLSHHDLIYIAVEGKEPIKTDVPSQLLYWLDQLSSFLNSTHQHVYYSDIVPTCMVSFIGWLLEYPIIYTTHLESDQATSELDEWEQRTNCLGGRYLRLVQLWLSDHMLLSYSYPIMEGCIHQPQTLQDQVNKRIRELKQQPTWLSDCTLHTQQIKLDRFAL